MGASGHLPYWLIRLLGVLGDLYALIRDLRTPTESEVDRVDRAETGDLEDRGAA